MVRFDPRFWYISMYYYVYYQAPRFNSILAFLPKTAMPIKPIFLIRIKQTNILKCRAILSLSDKKIKNLKMLTRPIAIAAGAKLQIQDLTAGIDSEGSADWGNLSRVVGCRLRRLSIFLLINMRLFIECRHLLFDNPYYGS